MTDPFDPGPPDTEHQRSFRTHAAYLRSFREMAVGTSYHPLAIGLTELATRARPQSNCGTAGKNVNVEDVLSCLRRAWSTEFILDTTAALADGSEVIRMANSWGAVQAYYVMYGVTQAVLVAEGNVRPEAHEPTRKAFINLWVTRKLDLAPWTFAVASPSTRLADTAGFLGGPARALDPSIHPWSGWGGDQHWDIAGKALTSTRTRHLQTAFSDARDRKKAQRRRGWKAEEAARSAASRPARKEPTWWDRQPQLTAEEQTNLRQGTRPSTMMDYLYRLRIKANYVDDGMFAEGPDDDTSAAMMAHNLVALTSATLLVHEMRLSQLLGLTTFLAVVDDWLSRYLSPTNGGLSGRRAMLG